jgi:hypothetical protein
VCEVNVPEQFVADHTRVCIGRADTREEFAKRQREKEEEETAQRPKRADCPTKRLPNLVYTLVTDKMLRGKLKALGLSAKGNRFALEWRHREYVVRHNAECDASDPKTIPEIIAEIVALEEATAAAAAATAAAPEAKVSDPAFQRLIDEIRLRKSSSSSSSSTSESLLPLAIATSSLGIQTGSSEFSDASS